jgi:hypothetical protein
MTGIGPFQPNNIARIAWEVVVNGVPTEVASPRIQRIIQPNGTDIAGYPRSMFRVKEGTYMLETAFLVIGNYTAIMQGEYGNNTIENIAEFVVEKPFGFPRIEVASDS